MVIAFVSALIGGFIYTILNMIEKVEEISVEVRIRQLQSAVKWKFSELMLDSDLSKIKKYNGANPFVWISFNATIEDKSNHKDRKKKDKTKTEK